MNIKVGDIVRSKQFGYERNNLYKVVSFEEYYHSANSYSNEFKMLKEDDFNDDIIFTININDYSNFRAISKEYIITEEVYNSLLYKIMNEID